MIKNILTNSVFQRIALVGIIILIFIFWRNSIENKEIELAKQKQNALAMTGKIERLETKYNTQLTKTYSLLYDKDSLQKYSADLKASIERLKKTIPDADVYSSTEVDIEINGFSGTSTNTEMEYEDGHGVFKWEFENDTVGYKRFLSGKTEYELFVSPNLENSVNIVPGETTILRDDFEIELFLHSVVNDDKTLSVYAETTNKNVKIKQLKNTFDPIIVKKQIDHYTGVDNYSIDWGIQLGVGVNPLSINDPRTGEFKPVFYIGAGLNFNFSNITRFDW